MLKTCRLVFEVWRISSLREHRNCVQINKLYIWNNWARNGCKGLYNRLKQFGYLVLLSFHFFEYTFCDNAIGNLKSMNWSFTAYHCHGHCHFKMFVTPSYYMDADFESEVGIN